MKITSKVKQDRLKNVAFAEIKARTAEIVVGNRYFLSSFYGNGAWVRVTSKSTEINMCGWPSTVTYESIEPVGTAFNVQKHFAPGKTGTVNASNLYDTIEAALPQNKRK